jgi:hypothetical protein
MGGETYARALTTLKEEEEAIRTRAREDLALSLRKEAQDLSHQAKQKKLEARRCYVKTKDVHVTVISSDEDEEMKIKEEPSSPMDSVVMENLTLSYPNKCYLC